MTSHHPAAAVKTYRAEFFTAADYAARNFEAETPEQALELARQFYEDDLIALDFRSYDDNAGIDHIQIWDNERGTLASWESDDYRMRKAAAEMLSALQLILPNYADFLRAAGVDLEKCKGYQRAKAAVANAAPKQIKGGHNAS
jgi:hypothetical protein